MQVSVTFRHIDPTEALKSHAVEKLSHLKKYFEDPVHIHVVLSAEKHSQRADIQMDLHAVIMRGEDDSGDLYYSIDRAVEKLEAQIRRHKDKITHHHHHKGHHNCQVEAH